MTTSSPSDGSPDPEGEPAGDAPFLPPARPATPVPTDAPADAPFLPSASAPSVSAPTATATSTTAPSFDAKSMVESQKHYNANPAYGALPAGTDASRDAARKLREKANRKRRRGKTAGRVLALIALVGLGVGGYFVYQALQDDPPPLDGQSDPDAADGDGGALTPLGEQEQVIDALDDLNSGATPSAGGLLDAVDDAREAVGQAEPPVAAPTPLMVADVFTPAVLDHTDVLDPVDGLERFVVRASELAAINPSAHTALVDRLLALPQVAEGDERLAAVPVVLPGDIGIVIERDADQIVRIAAVASDPPIRAAGP